jgi:hypothetical protein
MDPCHGISPAVWAVWGCSDGSINDDKYTGRVKILSTLSHGMHRAIACKTETISSLRMGVFEIEIVIEIEIDAL